MFTTTKNHSGKLCFKVVTKVFIDQIAVKSDKINEKVSTTSMAD